MANYRFHRIICSKEFLEEYLFDYCPFGKYLGDSPYITFNKLFQVLNTSEYSEKYGAYIYYGFGFNYQYLDDGKCEVKFATRWDSPIPAIKKAISLEHSLKWYEVEEACESILLHHWSNGVRQTIFGLDEKWEEWSRLEEQLDFEDTLEGYDHLIWYYLNDNEEVL